MVCEILVQNVERDIDEDQIAQLEAMTAGPAELRRSKTQQTVAT